MTSSANTVWTRDTSIHIQTRVNIDGFMAAVDEWPCANIILQVHKHV